MHLKASNQWKSEFSVTAAWRNRFTAAFTLQSNFGTCNKAKHHSLLTCVVKQRNSDAREGLEITLSEAKLSRSGATH